MEVYAQGSGTIPAAQGGVQNTYRVTVKLSIYNGTNCTAVGGSSYRDIQQAFVQNPYTTTKTSQNVTADGYYLVTAEMYSQKKPPGGVFGTATLLDRKTWQFKIGSPNDLQPIGFFCTGENTPVTVCEGPTPPDGEESPPGLVGIDGHYKVVGSASSTKKYKFTMEFIATGPEPLRVISYRDTPGGPVPITRFTLFTAVTMEGDYDAFATIHVQRTDKGSTDPNCFKKHLLAETSWQFSIKKKSSSSSSSSSSPSSSSSSSSSSPPPSSSSP